MGFAAARQIDIAHSDRADGAPNIELPRQLDVAPIHGGVLLM